MTKHSTYNIAVANLQRYLRQLSYTNAEISSPPIDGIFEDKTRRSLTEFQKLYGLPQSGVADKASWDKLYLEYLRSLALYSPPLSLNIFPRVPDGYSVTLGDEFFLVSVIQFLLNELRIIYDSFIPLLVSGIYDETTAENIRIFQRKNKINETGTVNKETWDALVEAWNKNAANYVN